MFRNAARASRLVSMLAGLLLACSSSAQPTPDRLSSPTFTLEPDPASDYVGVGTQVYFVADDGLHGEELWVSDGTPAGTRMVVDLSAGSASSNPRELTALGGELLFVADEPGHGEGELWMSDGTPEGTQLLLDLAPGVAGAQASQLVSNGSLVLFSAWHPDSGFEAWVTDGTEPGTILLGDIAPPDLPGLNPALNPTRTGKVGSQFYFAIDDGVVGIELWTSDGTPGGTRLVSDINPGPSGSEPQALVEWRGRVVFVANHPDYGLEHWVSDGTMAGTFLLGDVNPAMGVDGARRLLPAGPTSGDVYFAGNDGVAGWELWASDGTPASTRLVADLRPGFSSSYPEDFTEVGGVVYFTAEDAVAGVELFKTDGTPGGTQVVKDIVPGIPGSYPRDLTVHAGVLYFRVTLPGVGNQIWTTDGTDSGTTLFFEPPSAPGSQSVRGLTSTGGRLSFTASSTDQDREPWVSDGTMPGTLLLKDIGPEQGRQQPARLRTLGGLAFGEVERAVSTERGLIVSDGVPGEAAYLAPILPASLVVSDTHVFAVQRLSGQPRELIAMTPTLPPAPVVLDSGLTQVETALLAGRLYFAKGTELWRTLPDASGTELVYSGVEPRYPAATNSRVFFMGNNGTDWELWSSDGTGPGTAVVATLGPNCGGCRAPGRFLTAVGDRIFFAGWRADIGTELWTSDGTGPGTLPLEVAPGPAHAFDLADARFVVDPAGLLYFTADDGTSGLELWRSDGTPSGTRLVADLDPGAAGSGPDELYFASGVLLFSAASRAEGRELWTSDGTPVGTVRVSDILPGERSSAPSGFEWLPTESGWAFAAGDDATGREVWLTDGTPGGTRLLADVLPGPESSSPIDFVETRNVLYFGADGDRIGSELWALRAGAGLVPDGATVGGGPLLMTKGAGGQLVLTWSATCNPADDDFSVLVGATGSYQSHDSVLCTTGGATTVSFPDPGGSFYFLISSHDGTTESAPGLDSFGSLRPDGVTNCHVIETNGCR